MPTRKKIEADKLEKKKGTENFNTLIGRNLRKQREKMDLSQENVADMMGKKSYTDYGNIELGKKRLIFEDAVKLAALFNITLDEIYNPGQGGAAQERRKAESPPRLGKRMQFLIDLDGSDDQLKDQIRVLEGINEVLKQQWFK